MTAASDSMPRAGQFRRLAGTARRRLFAAAATAALLATAVFSQGALAQSLREQPGVSAPTIEHLVAGEEAFTVVWSAPPEAAAATTVTYDVRWIRSDATHKSDGRWSRVTGAAAEPGRLVVRELTNDVGYDVQVRAATDQPGVWSATSTVTPSETPDVHSAAAPAVTLGVPIAARRDNPSDADVFKLVLSEPTRLLIRAPDDTPASETFSAYNHCSLLDEDGEELAQSGGGGFPSNGDYDTPPSDAFGGCVIHYQAPAGTYYVETYFPGRTCPTACWNAFGKYLLHVDAQSEPGSTIADAVPIAVGELKGGKIASADDVEYLRLDGGETDEFVALAFRAPEGVSVKVSLVDGDGDEVSGSNVRISCNDDGCFWAGADIGALLPAGTTYYAKVEADSDDEDTLGFYGVARWVDVRYAAMMSTCTSAVGPTGWNDALSGCQWRLFGSGPVVNYGDGRYDANVPPAHAAGQLGDGVAVSVVDTGIDVYHEDLTDNADVSRSHAYCGDDTAPFSDTLWHGTAVAGLVAARDNSVGVRGVAPRATLYSRRLFCYGPTARLTSANIADAWTRDMADIAVSSNSWGASPSPYAKPRLAVEDLAVERALVEGFDGKGTVFVFAAGNGNSSRDNSNLDGAHTHHGAIVVCATDEDGMVAHYSELGSNLWVCGPAGGRSRGIGGMATTVNHDRYRDSVGGTSFAAPIVAGVAALVRAENLELTWRDVKLILAGSAQHERYENHYHDGSWHERVDHLGHGFEQGGHKYGSDTERYWYSHGYGFGVVDADAAVQLAQDWTLLPEMITATASGAGLTVPDDSYRGSDDDGSEVTSTVTFDGAINFVEWVEIDTDFEAESFRQLRLELVSPSGAVATLVPQLDGGGHYELSEPYRFASARHLGESAEGTWTLRIGDYVPGAEEAVLNGWSITLYGHRRGPSAPTSVSVEQAEAGELHVSWEAPAYEGGSSVTGYELRHGAVSGDLEARVRTWLIDQCNRGTPTALMICDAWGVGSPPDPDFSAASARLLLDWCVTIEGANPVCPPHSVLHPPPEWIVVEVPGGADATSHTITGLDAVSHEVQVRALHGDGAGEWSAVLSGTPIPDAEPPVVTAVEVVSDAGIYDTYAMGDVISVRVTFDKAVEVTGTPTLGIDMDSAHWGRKDAVYIAGSGTAELTFAHEVIEPNFSSRGIAVLADTLALNGGTIQAASGGDDAELAHSGLGHDPEHMVDWRQSPPDASGNRAPVFGGADRVMDNALPGYLVTLPVPKDDFWDPDGDSLTFTLSASRDDVHIADGYGYIEQHGRIWFWAKTACALAALDPPTADAFYTVITLTATDPGGAAAQTTATFRTNPAEFTCPAVSSAAVDGATLTISLAADGVLPLSFRQPAAVEFEVKADGAAVALGDTGAVSASDTAIVLTLASPVTAAQTVTVSYTPGDDPMAAAFADQAVTNNTPAPPEPEAPEQPEAPGAADCTPDPNGHMTPVCATVSGNELTLTFNRDLAALSDSAARTLRWAFVVDGAHDLHGAPVNSQSPLGFAVDGNTLTLTLGSAITPGNDATVRYYGGLYDADGTAVASFAITLTATQRD